MYTYKLFFYEEQQKLEHMYITICTLSSSSQSGIVNNTRECVTPRLQCHFLFICMWTLYQMSHREILFLPSSYIAQLWKAALHDGEDFPPIRRTQIKTLHPILKTRPAPLGLLYIELPLPPPPRTSLPL